MDITLLKGKLHMATVTQAELWYDGSCAIDENLVELSGLREFEKIEIYNVDNGERFSTYVILADAGSGTISMNGAAARKVQVATGSSLLPTGRCPNRKLTRLCQAWFTLAKRTPSSAPPTRFLYKLHSILNRKNSGR